MGAFEDMSVPKRRRPIGLWIALGVVAVMVAGFFLLRSPVRQFLLRSRYTLAQVQMHTGEYDRAIEEFSALGDYEDSAHFVQECYYYKGMLALADKDYETAVDCFACASDFGEAERYSRQAIYEWGHSLFMEDKYPDAEGIFARLNGQYPDYGAPHFVTLEQAWDYCAAQRDALTMAFSCYIAQMPECYKDEQLLWDTMCNQVTYQVFAVEYDWEARLLIVEVTAYYPSDRMLYAWRTGDTTVLQAGENEVLEQALSLVAQADDETDTDLQMQLWLHDWLCDHVCYANPNMDVPTPEYLKLRELTCVGALTAGTAHCQGYTDAFYLLGNLAGLQVEKLSGETDESHMWNVICMDDVWYTVDVTYNDVDDEDTNARTYTWFNSAYAPEERTISGGAEAWPGLARTINWDVTYYGMHGCVYDSMDDAVYAMLQQYVRNGSGWVYAVVEGVESDSDGFYAAVDRNMLSTGVRSVRWSSVIECYQGNTYMSIYWE